MLQDGGRIGYKVGGKKGNTGKASQVSSEFNNPSANRVAAATNIKSMQDALGTKGSISKQQQDARDRLRDQRQGANETIRQQREDAVIGRGPYELENKDLSFVERMNRFGAQKFTNLRKNTLRNLIDYIGGGRQFKYPVGSIYTDLTGKGLNMAIEDYLDLEGVSPSQLSAMFGQDIIGTPDEQKIRDISKVLGQDVITQSEFEQFYPNMNVPDDRGGPDQQETDPCKGPNPPAYCFANQDPTDPNQTTDVFAGIAPRFSGSIFDFDKLRREQEEEEQSAADGGRIGAMEGGIMDLETGRQMYFLGKLVKKATRAIKKITKSPIGKAAILGGALYFGGGGGLPKLLGGKGLGGFSAKTFFSKANPLLFSEGKLSMGKLAGLSAISPFLFQEEEEEDTYKGPDIDIANIRANPYNFIAPRFAADGGLMRMGYQEGSKEPVAKKTMPLLDMDGKEMDLRDNGGFVPIGRMEKADDVPARLSKNEFVFTADAVRNAGDGNVDKGAEVMYNMMKNLESGGDVSEESQGLQGARDMFQTSKRLEEVL